jgi:hypothetical protein
MLEFFAIDLTTVDPLRGEERVATIRGWVESSGGAAEQVRGR